MTERGNQTILSLEGDLTIYQAVELKRQLMDFLAGAQAPCLDLSAVTEMDTSGLQLLLLAQHSAAAAGKPLRFTSPSRAVAEVLSLCHLTASFGDADATAFNP